MGIALGVSRSLRNAHFGAGTVALIEEIMAVEPDDGLARYLEAQTRIRQEGLI